MAEQSIIKVNKSSTTEIEFEVDVAGLDEPSNKSTVRFVIEDAGEDYDILVYAKHIKDNTWKLTIPSLAFLKKSTYKSRLEVVLDGYYFVPATATISMTDEPTIKIVSKTTKPLTEAELLEFEAAGAGTAFDQPANSNLADIVEFPPESKVKSQYPKNTDEHTDAERLNQDLINDMASRVTDVEGPQIDAPEKESAASKIVKSVIGNIKKPSTSGTLFKRNASGKAIVKGLEDDVTKAEITRANEAMEEKAIKVRNILKNVK
jgi:hypothetical protein